MKPVSDAERAAVREYVLAHNHYMEVWSEIFGPIGEPVDAERVISVGDSDHARLAAAIARLDQARRKLPGLREES